jgi:hypothetical protein
MPATNSKSHYIDQHVLCDIAELIWLQSCLDNDGMGVSWQEYRSRLKPRQKKASAERAWERLKANLRRWHIPHVVSLGGHSCNNHSYNSYVKVLWRCDQLDDYQEKLLSGEETKPEHPTPIKSTRRFHSPEIRDKHKHKVHTKRKWRP